MKFKIEKAVSKPGYKLAPIYRLSIDFRYSEGVRYKTITFMIVDGVPIKQDVLANTKYYTAFKPTKKVIVESVFIQRVAKNQCTSSGKFSKGFAFSYNTHNGYSEVWYGVLLTLVVK